ncbi:MAG: sulfotransferase domain-containing protein [Phycisphaerales bacterium JB059]
MGVTWIASYPKSGNTWVRFLLAHAMGATLERVDELGAYIPPIGRVEPDDPRLEADGGLPVKTHHRLSPELPLRERTDRAIYVIRDPRDVLLSCIRYMPFRQAVSDRRVPCATLPAPRYARRFVRTGGDPQWASGAFGTWRENVESWTEGAPFPVLTVRYEDLRLNASRELTRMLDFLGWTSTPALVRRAVERSDFERLRAAEQRRLMARGRPDGVRFFARGESGQRLDQIEPGLDDFFDDWFGEHAAAYGYARRLAA